MTTTQTISQAELDATDRQMNKLGAGFLFHSATLDTGAAEGFDNPIALYAGGRAGVLGDVQAHQVRSAFCFFNPAVVDAVWEQVLAAGSPSAFADVYARGIAEAARMRFTDEDASATVARVGGALADAVQPMGYALFTGWRAMCTATDAKGAAGQVIMALRELRFDVHIQALAGQGLAPLEAEMVTRGPDGARLHGWAEPYPDPAPYVERVAAAEAETSARMRRFYDQLPTEDVAAFVQAVATLAATPAA